MLRYSPEINPIKLRPLLVENVFQTKDFPCILRAGGFHYFIIARHVPKQYNKYVAHTNKLVVFTCSTSYSIFSSWQVLSLHNQRIEDKIPPSAPISHLNSSRYILFHMFQLNNRVFLMVCSTEYLLTKLQEHSFGRSLAIDSRLQLFTCNYYM